MSSASVATEEQEGRPKSGPAEVEASAGADRWLVVVDPQVIFADPESKWAAPRFQKIVEPVRQLAAAFGDRVVITRWVPPEQKVGSWVPYFEQFAFADQPPDHHLFDLVPQAADLGARHTVSEPTFGKWGEQLQAITGPTPHLVLAGVATDCCVISTALPAIDAGAQVTVASDACAGSDDENHQRALDAMGLYAPQLFVVTTAEVLALGEPREA
ncbi:cysteine hydrolase family protein [Ornithinimicrobium cryptoxanthini]|uniref:Cysteine hydrolase n=1 Tax=Ornithinimicrobium cryptoxanthini TaxID=2934161 RepID=A0ABY4YJM3_9MICO|nr:cysteine hydrolase [Ornithinimicrobium cryptoxanthini]USQ76819.1 cysteine hydrolase [Ornithinimicrobium cryptoxanthini]